MKTRCKILISSLAILASSSSIALLPQELKVVDVIAVEYPPFTSAKMQTNGLSFEILNRAAKHLEYTWKPVFYPPKRALKMIQGGNWCASFYPANTYKDHHVVDLHKEEFQISLVRRKVNTPFRWKQLSEHKGKTVALLRTNEDSTFARQFIEAGITVMFVETISASLKMVEHGRVDFAMYDSFSFGLLEDEQKSALQFASTSLLKMPVRMFINKNCLNVDRLSLQPVNSSLYEKRLY